MLNDLHSNRIGKLLFQYPLHLRIESLFHNELIAELCSCPFVIEIRYRKSEVVEIVRNLKGSKILDFNRKRLVGHISLRNHAACVVGNCVWLLFMVFRVSCHVEHLGGDEVLIRCYPSTGEA